MPDALTDRLERLAQMKVTVRLFDITTDFQVPIILCIAASDSFPYIVAGAACRADPGEACMKAVDEAVAMRFGLPELKASIASIPSRPEDVHSLNDHALYYADKSDTGPFAFLSEGRRAVVGFDAFAARSWWHPPSNMNSLRRIAAHLKLNGLTVLWTDVTCPEATVFGRVVKVVVPEMIPLSPDHGIRWLATPRLLKQAGLQTASAAAFNPLPHPFA
jgi:ribosomal protein S12 methylthiotransferase accessory factor